MKKLIIFLMITITIFCVNLSCYAEKIIYLDETIDESASKILYKYLLKDIEMTPKRAYDAFGYELSVSRAVFYDLDSDGVNEVIGYMDVPYSFCVGGADLFILKKTKDGYKDISGVEGYPHLGIHVHDTRTSGYFDLTVYTTKEWIPRVVKYIKEKERYNYFFPN